MYQCLRFCPIQEKMQIRNEKRSYNFPNQHVYKTKFPQKKHWNQIAKNCKKCVLIILSIIVEAKLVENFGKLTHAQFPHNQTITDTRGTQALGELPQSGDSGFKSIGKFTFGLS